MKLASLLPICAASSIVMKVCLVYQGEDIIGKPDVLMACLTTLMLNMKVIGVFAEDKNMLKVWVEDENA